MNGVGQGKWPKVGLSTVVRGCELATLYIPPLTCTYIPPLVSHPSLPKLNMLFFIIYYLLPK